MIKVNFALLLDEKVFSECISYSQQLGELIPSNVVLGPENLPHISILQFECKERKMERIWKRTISFLQPSYYVNFSGLTLLPSSSGKIWVEIQVLKSQEILGLQSRLLKLRGIKGNKIFNAVGDKYRPHVTINLFAENPKKSIPLPYSPLRNTNVLAKASLGFVGENYTYTKPAYIFGK